MSKAYKALCKALFILSEVPCAARLTCYVIMTCLMIYTPFVQAQICTPASVHLPRWSCLAAVSTTYWQDGLATCNEGDKDNQHPWHKMGCMSGQKSCIISIDCLIQAFSEVGKGIAVVEGKPSFCDPWVRPANMPYVHAST